MMASDGKRPTVVMVSAGVAMIVLAVAVVAVAAPLPAGLADENEVSVSGVSSGGYMAVQLHVAHSATFKKGAGVVAGGPFFCAEGSISNALGRCMAHGSPIPVAHLVSTTTSWAQSGLIDPVSHLAASKVYLFTGRHDTVVKSGVVDDLHAYYRALVPDAQIVLKNDLPAEHAMVTDDFGSACPTLGDPFINDCDFDLAGAILQHLHGPLAPRNDGALGGRLAEFDQREFATGHGLGAGGWVYVPADCTATSKCTLHVALHGCKQNGGDIGDAYARRTGYNRWADSNRIVVLYPQTGAGATNSCWDWWGYAGADYAKKSGAQVAALKAMVDRLTGTATAGTEPRCHTATNLGHVWAGRATMAWGAIFARGSGESLGWWFGTTTLKEDPPGHFALGTCS
jgi:poly(3-hydroxybutyrate) depolymerase